MITVVRSTEDGASRESLRVLGRAKQAARPEDVRQWPGTHLEDGDEGLGSIGDTLACKYIDRSHKTQTCPVVLGGKDSVN